MRSIILIGCVCYASMSMAQVAINYDGTAAENSSMLEVKSNNKGVLIPRMTLTGRDGITNPATGLLIYQTDNNPGFYYNIGTSTPDWRIVGHNAGTFSQWVTQSNNIYYNTGNVGVGTTTPDAKVEAVSASFLAELAGSSRAVYGEHSVSSSYGWLGASNEGGYGYSANGYGLRGNSVNGYALYGQATGTGYAGYFSGKTHIDGNLGIGEPAPNRKLYVSDLQTGLSYPLKVENKHSVVNEAAVGILFSTGGSGTNNRGKGALAYEYTSTWNRGSFHILQNAAANEDNPSLANSVMTITNSGNVGIGTTNPLARLDVSANAGPNLIIRDANASNDRPGIQFINNYIHFISGDDGSDEYFGFYSGYGSTRNYDAHLAVYGKATSDWGKYLAITHNGTDGRIYTDAGDILMQPAGGGVAINNTSAGSYSLYVTGDTYISGNINTATKTDYLILSPAEFQVYSYNDTYFNGGDYLENSLGGTNYYYAAIHLPSNATISSITSYWMDNSASNCELYLLRTDIINGGEDIMAQTLTSWQNGTRTAVTDNSILNATIDNYNYQYLFRLIMPTGNFYFYGVRIAYTYSQF